MHREISPFNRAQEGDRSHPLISSSQSSLGVGIAISSHKGKAPDYSLKLVRSLNSTSSPAESIPRVLGQGCESFRAGLVAKPRPPRWASGRGLGTGYRHPGRTAEVDPHVRWWKKCHAKVPLRPTATNDSTSNDERRKHQNLLEFYEKELSIN